MERMLVIYKIRSLRILNVGKPWIRQSFFCQCFKITISTNNFTAKVLYYTVVDKFLKHFLVEILSFCLLYIYILAITQMAEQLYRAGLRKESASIGKYRHKLKESKDRNRSSTVGSFG